MFHAVSKVILCGRRNTFDFASFSEDELHFPWRAQHFGDLQRHFGCRGRRGTSDVPCCVFFANRIVGSASSGGNLQIQ